MFSLILFYFLLFSTPFSVFFSIPIFYHYCLILSLSYFIFSFFFRISHFPRFSLPTFIFLSSSSFRSSFVPSLIFSHIFSSFSPFLFFTFLPSYSHLGYFSPSLCSLFYTVPFSIFFLVLSSLFFFLSYFSLLSSFPDPLFFYSLIPLLIPYSYSPYSLFLPFSLIPNSCYSFPCYLLSHLIKIKTRNENV